MKVVGNKAMRISLKEFDSVHTQTADIGITWS